MGLFKFGKRKDVVDLGERFKKQQEKIDNLRAENQEDSQTPQPSSSQGAFSFLGNLASSSKAQSDEYVDVSESVEDKRKRLAKRLMDMTSKIEDLSNQLYHLQQRIELLEKKMGAGNY